MLWDAWGELRRLGIHATPCCAARTHPGADELLVEDDPGHEVDEADAGGEEGGDLGGAQDLEGEHVQVGGQRPQQREEEAPHEEGPCKTTKRKSLLSDE